RAGGEDQAVVGMIPRHVALALARLLVEDARAEADAAELLAHVGGAAPRLAPALALGEIDAEDLAGESAGHRGLRVRGLLRSARHHWSHTATGESPGAIDGRPRTVSGSRVRVVLEAMNAILTSNGFRLRCSLKRPSGVPACTRPFSMPTSLVVQMSFERPMMMAPVSRSPVNSSLR